MQVRIPVLTSLNLVLAAVKRQNIYIYTYVCIYIYKPWTEVNVCNLHYFFIMINECNKYLIIFLTNIITALTKKTDCGCYILWDLEDLYPHLPINQLLLNVVSVQPRANKMISSHFKMNDLFAIKFVYAYNSIVHVTLLS